MTDNQLKETLYPSINPFEFGFLKVDETHKIYWEQSGNPSGVPVVFFHGGPGAGTHPFQRRYFDPSYYRIILFDQRGSGKSLPYAEIKNNTIWHLIDDIEKLRILLKIKQWIIFGGSWGVTLAIAYGKEHPERCMAFVLRGIFLGRDTELSWFLDTVGAIFPEAHEKFRNFLPEKEQKHLLFNFHQRLVNPNPEIHIPATQAWNNYEAACSTLLPHNTNNPGSPSLALARIEAHYFIHNMFLKDNPLLKNLIKVSQTPAKIVQGRYDIVCPIKSAIELSSNWTNSSLEIIPDAGHSSGEPGIRSALIKIMNEMRV